MHGVDRRAFTVLAGVALAGAGDPVAWQPGDPYTLCQFERLAANLACAYDAVGPSRAGAYAGYLEAEAAGLAGRLRRGPARQSAQALQARLLAVSATAAGDLGHYNRSYELALRAVDVAEQVEDRESTGHALALVAAALRDMGNCRGALSVAGRAARTAAGGPAEVCALLCTAGTTLRLGGREATLDAVARAEQAHARLPARRWGAVPGYQMATFHPARLATVTGRILAEAGEYAEATPRLADAAAILADVGAEGSEVTDVRLTQAWVALARGDVAAAHSLAAAAVDREKHRPSAWVVRRLTALDRQERRVCGAGVFGSLLDEAEASLAQAVPREPATGTRTTGGEHASV